ncbi:hypothetical protein, partial [Halovivax sp.]|uniref:hypothetical protein n=1 Tax=Halovivax sp. TaxID=1935978 RepID=UPI0025B83781
MKRVAGGSVKLGSLAAGTTLVAMFALRSYVAYVERGVEWGSQSVAGTAETAAITAVATLAICGVFVASGRGPTDAITARSVDRPLAALAAGVATLAAVGVAG